MRGEALSQLSRLRDATLVTVKHEPLTGTVARATGCVLGAWSLVSRRKSRKASIFVLRSLVFRMSLSLTKRAKFSLAFVSGDHET